MNTAQLSLDNIRDYGEYTATWFDERSITNLQQYERACKVATMLQNHGVSAGKRVIVMMLNSPDRDQYDVSSLTHVGSGDAPIPEAVCVEFEKVFDCTVKQGYGLSETAAALSGYRPDEPDRVGSVGRPLPGIEACILDNKNRTVAAGESGEICAHGFSRRVSKEYNGEDPEASVERPIR